MSNWRAASIEKRNASWDSIAQIAQTGDGRPWTRKIAGHPSTYFSGMSMPGPTFVNALTNLRQEERRRVIVALTAAKNHYQSFADMLGTAGIPVFVGFLAWLSSDGMTFPYFLAFMATLILYISMYMANRILAAVASTGIESLRLLLELSSLEAHLPPNERKDYWDNSQ